MSQHSFLTEPDSLKPGHEFPETEREADTQLKTTGRGLASDLPGSVSSSSLYSPSFDSGEKKISLLYGRHRNALGCPLRRLLNQANKAESTFRRSTVGATTLSSLLLFPPWRDHDLLVYIQHRNKPLNRGHPDSLEPYGPRARVYRALGFLPEASSKPMLSSDP